MNSNELKKMYGATPESFTRRVAFALQKTEEKPMKHTARTILITAAIIALLTAVAYAAFSSQVTELFGTLYGDDTKSWLEEGSVATTDQSYTLGDVVFTVDEVVYRDNGLYGVGTIRPADGSTSVVISEDQTPDMPYGYDIHGSGGVAETAPADAKTIAEVAKEQGGKILMAVTRLSKIGVDGGEMLSPGCSGYSMAQQRDGSVRFSFEVSDSTVVEEGQTYQIEMRSYFYEMGADGELLQDTKQGGYWLIEIEPEPISEQTEESTAETTLTQTIDDVELIVPDEYTINGTLPVYSTTARDFGAGLDPALFNQSGILKTEDYLITFNDEATLSWSAEALDYSEYQGTYNGNYRNPDLEPEMFALKSLNHAAYDLAGYVYFEWPERWEGITLSKTELYGITLDEAKAEVEALLEVLGVEGYTCDFALDMDVERIQSIGALNNQRIEENEYSNSPILDYSLATQENEGFYLHYGNGVKTEGNLFDLRVYVTSSGIAGFQLRDMYIQGEVYSTPEALVSPETVMTVLAAEMADSRFSDLTLDHIISIELVYSPARAADKADGMVLTPAWYVVYQDNEAVRDGYECCATFNAVDGMLLMSMF